MSTIVETLNIGFVIPLIEMECEMTLTLSQKGILNSAAFVGWLNVIHVLDGLNKNASCCLLIGVVTSSYFWGFLADWERGGRRKVMHYCTSIAFCFSVVSSFSVHVWMLIMTRFFVGFL